MYLVFLPVFPSSPSPNAVITSFVHTNLFLLFPVLSRSVSPSDTILVADHPTDDDARPSSQKLLIKWRPHILEESKPPPEATSNANPEIKSEAEPQAPPDTPAATNGIKSPVPNNIASDANGEVKGEVGSEGKSLEIAGAGAGADTGTRTEKGGSVVAAVG